MSAGDDRVLLGEIVAAHGIRGLVKVRAFTDDPEQLTGYGPLFDADGRELKLQLRGPTKGGVLAAVDGVGDRNKAEALRGTRLYVDRTALPVADADEFYHADLVGMQARLADGSVLGQIKAVQNFGAGDLLEVDLADRPGSVLVPFTSELVPVVDLDEGYVIVEPIPGLLD
jgi:16S rRNA processing protein RimM